MRNRREGVSDTEEASRYYSKTLEICRGWAKREIYEQRHICGCSLSPEFSKSTTQAILVLPEPPLHPAYHVLNSLIYWHNLRGSQSALIEFVIDRERYDDVAML